MDKQILHTGLVAILALGLGLSLASSRAIGYPAGAAVSMGANPLFAKGGELSGGSTTAFTALRLSANVTKKNLPNSRQTKPSAVAS